MKDVNVYLCAVGLQGFLFYKRSPNIPKLVTVYSLIAKKKKQKKAWTVLLSLSHVGFTLFTTKLVTIMGFEEIKHETAAKVKYSSSH